MHQIGSLLREAETPIADSFRALWDEYEAQQTEEAKLVKEIDLLDMVIQANSYEEKYRMLSSPDYDANVQDLSSFFESTYQKIYRFPSLQKIDEEVRLQRAIRSPNT